MTADSRTLVEVGIREDIVVFVLRSTLSVSCIALLNLRSVSENALLNKGTHGISRRLAQSKGPIKFQLRI